MLLLSVKLYYRVFNSYMSGRSLGQGSIRSGLLLLTDVSYRIYESETYLECPRPHDGDVMSEGPFGNGNKVLMMKFWMVLLQKINSVWLVIVLSLYINVPYVRAAQYMDNIETRFRQFIVEYNRTYARNSTEYAKRLAIFAVSSASSLSLAQPREACSSHGFPKHR